MKIRFLVSEKDREMTADFKQKAKFHNLYNFEAEYKSKLSTETLRNIWKRHADRSDLIISVTEFTAGLILGGFAGIGFAEGLIMGDGKELIFAGGSLAGGEALLFRADNFRSHGLFSKQFDDDGGANYYAQGNRVVNSGAKKEAHLLVTLRDLADRLVKPGAETQASSSRPVSTHPAASSFNVDEFNLV